MALLPESCDADAFHSKLSSLSSALLFGFYVFIWSCVRTIPRQPQDTLQATTPPVSDAPNYSGLQEIQCLIVHTFPAQENWTNLKLYTL